MSNLLSRFAESKEKRAKRERDKFLGSRPHADEAKPRIRNPEEIVGKYGKTEDASSAAVHARNKLQERQQKMERIGRNAEELKSSSEDFASMANKLVEKMEKKRWWQI